MNFIIFFFSSVFSSRSFESFLSSTEPENFFSSSPEAEKLPSLGRETKKKDGMA